MVPWFGDIYSLCFMACVPLPTCNLLKNATLQARPQPQSYSSTIQVHEQEQFHQCFLYGSNNNDSSIQDPGTMTVSLLGFFFIAFLLSNSHRKSSAVGRIEMSILFMIYSCILFLQIFTIGGVGSSSKKFIIWATALHLGATVSFFWTLIVNAFILYQFVDDGTKLTTRFITGTNLVWIAGTTFMSLDLTMDITGKHYGQSPGLFFLTLIFPAIAVLLYMILVTILVFRVLEVYKSLFYIAIASIMFAAGQVVRFGVSRSLVASTYGRVNGSMFGTLLDLISIALLYQFWNSITEGKRHLSLFNVVS
ncbi:chitin synthase III catalytic subunit [Lobosporangium transversale]|uniref:Chitin synthase III catalytic subunit n=1 Tax=Lobosporangium transversale TaxID=64571 RepID=A0A1Y2H595_9FUNG|nr:chitin synthase III catalytic subunit [Lobosporangium transversale]ORZ28883.1 chitin synthase III catalytic subunit [Lobosporangium transversale]|eukprot:XP_021886556.1 chitin synthase III catalytic subunit [Lobosporangium transversale]